jgi:hypothetical protein
VPTDLLTHLKAALKDRYEVEREIGQGGMATVFLAKDLKDDRKVAIKVLHDDIGTAMGPERFRREIEISTNLSHPHILQLVDSGMADGRLYYVMPFVEGESLRERIDRDKDAAHQGGARGYRGCRGGARFCAPEETSFTGTSSRREHSSAGRATHLLRTSESPARWIVRTRRLRRRRLRLEPRRT